MCGGTIEFEKGNTVGICDSCGTKQTLPKTNDDVIANLFNRANNLRLKCEFDKAAQIYEKIVEQDDSEAEAHWGIVLCKYGIEYVEDPKTFKRIPTCHRTLYQAILADHDYQSAIDYSDSFQQIIYESEARTIDKIQKDILAIVKNEKPFDVFICYKETDENGKRTVDSTIANDIYYQLTQEGFKVFFAAITLEDKLGQEYEPYIFAALNSAKVMLVIGTKPEYFSSVWVKNEWSRYLQLMKSNRSKLLIPCYRDMDAYDLPEEFAHLQAQNMGKIGFVNDVIRGIKKVIQNDEKAKVVVKESNDSVVPLNISPLLERAAIFLEDEKWTEADDYCEKVLDQSPKNAQAYIYKLMATIHVRKQENLINQILPFDDNDNYQKAVRFADDKLKTELIGYIEQINTRNYNMKREKEYKTAVELMDSVKWQGFVIQESIYLNASKIFDSISDYKDAANLSQECKEKAEEARKNVFYLNATNNIRIANNIVEYEYNKKIVALKNAKTELAQIAGWKDADDLLETCNKKIEEINIQIENERFEKEKNEEIARKQKELRAKRNKKNAIITILIACVLMSFLILLNNVIIPTVKYNDAIALMDAGNIVEAYEALAALDGYKDSTDKANSIYDKYKVEKLKVAKVGDYVFFGAYEQDNNISNGKEDVEWLVLEVKDGKVLVISKYALDCKQYNTSYTDVTWETCTLRRWLNNDFINAAFSTDEKAMIPTVTVSADKNPEYSTNPGNETQDQLFLLSIMGANNYFSSDSARQCEATNYAVANGAYVNGGNSNCDWWLRSPGRYQNRAATVSTVGVVAGRGSYVTYGLSAVRPALWIDLNA